MSETRLYNTILLSSRPHRVSSDFTYLRLSLSLPRGTLHQFPSPPPIAEIYWKVRPRCIVRVQELFADNGSLHIFSLFFLIHLSLALFFVLSPSSSALSPLPLFLLPPPLSLSSCLVIREIVCVSRHCHSLYIDGHERERAHGRLKFWGREVDVFRATNCRPRTSSQPAVQQTGVVIIDTYTLK